MNRRRFTWSMVQAAAATLLAACARRDPLTVSLPLSPAPMPTMPNASSGADSLRRTAAHRGMLFGAVVESEAFVTDPGYARLAIEQCNLLVPSKAFRWDQLCATSDAYAFDLADEAVAFAEAHRVKLRGASLLDAAHLPPWFAARTSASNARQLLTLHIDQVAGRYSARMHSWNVAASVVEGQGGRQDGLRENAWLALLGPEYLEAALRQTRRADPQALLSLSEEALAGPSAAAHGKRTAMLLLLRRLRARRVPIDALEIAAVPGETVAADFLLFLDEVKKLDLQVFLARVEYFAQAPGAGGSAHMRAAGSALADILATGAVRVAITPALCAAHPADAALSTPPLFDRSLEPTRAFFALRNSLAG